jgi:hypothetical protein
LELYVNARTSQKARRSNGIDDGDGGLRPSHQALLRLIDTTDPAWPSVAAVLREMADAGVKISEAVYEIAAKLGTYRHRLAMLDADQSRHRQPAYVQITLAVADSSSIVYYIRRGDLVKIGTTTGPAVRFRDLMPDEILAIEPGGEDLEVARHRQFDHLRYRGEYFRAAPELLEHAHQLRRLHGAPDPSWPTTATPGPQRPCAPLPPVTSHEMVTVSEAARRFGIKEQRIYGWARRDFISPAGRDGRHHLFYVEHIAAIRDRMDRHVPLQETHARICPSLFDFSMVKC